MYSYNKLFNYHSKTIKSKSRAWTAYRIVAVGSFSFLAVYVSLDLSLQKNLKIIKNIAAYRT